MHVERGGVHHHREVDAVERARADQVDLAAAALLGRCPEDGDPQPGLIGDRGEGEPGADRRRRDDVVPAGVPDTGQRVVLRAHHDVRTGSAGARRERRRQAVGAPLDAQPARLEQVGAPARRADLVVRQLRVGGDGVRQPDEFVGDRLEAGAGRLGERRAEQGGVDGALGWAGHRGIMPHSRARPRHGRCRARGRSSVALGTAARTRRSAASMAAATARAVSSCADRDLRGDQDLVRAHVQGAQVDHPGDLGGRPPARRGSPRPPRAARARRSAGCSSPRARKTAITHEQHADRPASRHRPSGRRR